MGPLLLLIAAGLGWGLWSGKLKPQQLLPIALVVAGAFLTIRGSWIIGLAAIGAGIAWYRGMTWRLFGLNSKQSDQYAIDQARWLLGVSAHDDEVRIRARHRQLIAENHPDRGGDEERAQKLNEARDLLLDDLAKKSR
jgi:hypothetical protein